MTAPPSNLPRLDFYQTDTHVIVSLYLKGYGTPEAKDKVAFEFLPNKVVVELPDLAGGDAKQVVELGPLYGLIDGSASSGRALSSKLELKLGKTSPVQWSSVIGDGTPAAHASTSYQPAPSSSSSALAPPKKERRNWDKVLDDELEEEKSTDPNAGGEAALKDFFSKLYADADEETKRAMIKSYTESGGTTLSTNWAEIGKETTPIRPPDGMEARKF